jgi:cholestenol delta-isomerase
MWTEIWLFASCLAHLHGSLPWIAADVLNDPANLNPVLVAYREWCLTDRRYCANDACVMAFQGLTALYGVPLCLLLIGAIRAGAWWRHIAQVCLCIPQAYGTLIYFGSAYVKGFASISADPLQFWGLFFGLNFLWVAIPAVMAYQSFVAIGAALREQAMRKQKKN